MWLDWEEAAGEAILQASSRRLQAPASFIGLTEIPRLATFIFAFGLANLSSQQMYAGIRPLGLSNALAAEH